MEPPSKLRRVENENVDRWSLSPIQTKRQEDRRQDDRRLEDRRQEDRRQDDRRQEDSSVISSSFDKKNKNLMNEFNNRDFENVSKILSLLRINSYQTGCRELKESYSLLNVIASGSYGTVYRALTISTGKIVALKSIKPIQKISKFEAFSVAAVRELHCLLSLNHPNVVNILEVVMDSKSEKIYIVMEYVEHELYVLLKNQKPKFSTSERKCLVKQLLSGVAYLHSKGFMNRDLKTQNLLYSNSGLLKLCDFGLARPFETPRLAGHSATPEVVTLWYRAPELILNESVYGSEIDVWSVGCIFGEIFGSQGPLFQSDNSVDCLNKIVDLLGSPPEDWPYSENQNFKKLINKKKTVHSSWDRVFYRSELRISGSHTLTSSGLDLLKRMLHWNPKERITAAEALEHEFFMKEKPPPQCLALMPTVAETNIATQEARSTGLIDEENGILLSSESGESSRMSKNEYLKHLNEESALRKEGSKKLK